MVKLRKIYFLLPLVALLFAFILPSRVQAATFEFGNYELESQSVVEDDLYVSGTNITISGVVDGDVLATGQTVTIDGTVTGNLFVAANSIVVDGNIYGNTIVAGSTLNLDGTLGGDVMAAGLTVNSSADISGDLTTSTGTLNLEGVVGDDVRAVSGDILSTATVGGDFVFASRTYTVEDGDVAGEIVNRTTESRPVTQEPIADRFTTVDLGFALIGFLGMYIVGALFIYLAPVKTVQIERNINSSWADALKSFAIGLLILFAIPLPLILLAATLIGAPLSLLILGALLFLTIFGTLWVEIAVGHKILDLLNQKDEKLYLSLLIGRLLSVLVRLIPVVGVLYSLALTMLAVGAVVRTKADVMSEARKSKKK